MEFYESYNIFEETMENILLTFIFNKQSVPSIYSLVILENYVPKPLGSTFSNEPLV